MSKTLHAATSFAVATVLVFGVIYLTDGLDGAKPPDKPPPMQEIKGSVGPVWAVGNGAVDENPDDAPAGKAHSAPQTSVRAQCDAWDKHAKQLSVFALGSSSDEEQNRIRQAQKQVRQKMLDLDCMRA